MLEALSRDSVSHEPPRASLLAAPGELAATAIWMGGAHTPVGKAIALDGAERAWFIDCAGDMPAAYRAAAGRWIARIFPDLDDVPSDLQGISGIVRSVAGALRDDAATAPDHLYVVCQHGMNRSGLVAGLLLRELGIPGPDAVGRIVGARPGALSNLAFRWLVSEGQALVPGR